MHCTAFHFLQHGVKVSSSGGKHPATELRTVLPVTLKPRRTVDVTGFRTAANEILCTHLIIIKVCVKRKLLAIETILSAYTRTHARTHTGARIHEHSDYTKLYLHSLNWLLTKNKGISWKNNWGHLGDICWDILVTYVVILIIVKISLLSLTCKDFKWKGRLKKTKDYLPLPQPPTACLRHPFPATAEFGGQVPESEVWSVQHSLGVLQSTQLATPTLTPNARLRHPFSVTAEFRGRVPEGQVWSVSLLFAVLLLPFPFFI